ncbi:MAG TPA: hypothetical protein PK358_03810 [Spirochaetota bacterium]|nr:hypothetical protein [Spirochaetota bacterium]HPJ33933.1 hypothetical protein [Spirochaetota bacterium]
MVSSSGYGEDGQGSLIKIISEIDSYRDKIITMNLRLKHYDRIFEKISFYDSENIDIEFDISGKERKKALAADMMNLHEGMLYSVTFRVVDTGNFGGLLGEVQGFTPVVLDLIPQNGKTGD